MCFKFKDYDWLGLDGGYRIPYDPREAIIELKDKQYSDKAWDKLWNNLHHQGDIGVASYAAVTALVELNVKQDLGWNLYSLVSCIELCRFNNKNPNLPDWLSDDYKEALQQLLEIACKRFVEVQNETEIRAMLGYIAIAKGNYKYGELMSYYSEKEISEIFKDFL